MDNQWLSLDEAAALSGKSSSTLRKKTYKKLIKSEYIDQKLVIDKQSLIDFYKIRINESQPQMDNKDSQADNHDEPSDNNKDNHELAHSYKELLETHNTMANQFIKEKKELVGELIEFKKDQLKQYGEFEKSLTQKAETIEEKDKIILQKNKDIVGLLFLFLLAMGAIIL